MGYTAVGDTYCRVLILSMMMRFNLYALLLSLFIFGADSMWAQSNLPKSTPRNIFEALDGQEEGEGLVTIDQPEEVRRLVGGTSSRARAILGREGNTTLMMGYRLQFYNSNLPRAKSEAEQRAARIRAIAPEHACYISYNAPFWKLVVGDFTSTQEARKARTELMKVLPQWGREAYVVRDRVRILNYVPNETEE